MYYEEMESATTGGEMIISTKMAFCSCRPNGPALRKKQGGLCAPDFSIGKCLIVKTKINNAYVNPETLA